MEKQSAQKHWINADFLAPNVMEVDVAGDAFAPAFKLAAEIEQVDAAASSMMLSSVLRFHVQTPASKWSSDILWISQEGLATYNFFNEMFQASGIADHVAERIDYQERIILYSGFFVTRGQCDKPHLHVDWVDGNNNAFTFLMPLNASCNQLGLTYVKATGEMGEYAYQIGKG